MTGTPTSAEMAVRVSGGETGGALSVAVADGGAGACVARRSRAAVAEKRPWSLRGVDVVIIACCVT